MPVDSESSNLSGPSRFPSRWQRTASPGSRGFSSDPPLQNHPRHIFFFFFFILRNLNKSSIAAVCPLFSLWWCDGNQVLYRKHGYSAHQALRQAPAFNTNIAKKKKSLEKSVCACELAHIYVLCYEILAPLLPIFTLQNSFLSYCKWAESALSV